MVKKSAINRSNNHLSP